MMDGIPSKIKWKYTSFLHCISSFEGTSHNFFTRQPPGLLVLIVLDFYISRFHFSKLFRTSFNNLWNKIFSWMFFLVADSLNFEGLKIQKWNVPTDIIQTVDEKMGSSYHVYSRRSFGCT